MPGGIKGISLLTNASRLFMVGIVAFVLLNALPALAVAPTNDDFDSPNEVVLGGGDFVNTEEATTAADDPDCFGNGHTVWYIFTPGEDVRLEAITIGSDYDTTLSAYTGSRGSLTQIACNNDAAGTLQSHITFDAEAFQTYFIMVGSFEDSPGGNLIVEFQHDLDISGQGEGSIIFLRGTREPNPAFIFFDAAETTSAEGTSTLAGSFGTFNPEGEQGFSGTIDSGKIKDAKSFRLRGTVTDDFSIGASVTISGECGSDVTIKLKMASVQGTYQGRVFCDA
jgi:hypothetical protein